MPSREARKRHTRRMEMASLETEEGMRRMNRILEWRILEEVTGMQYRNTEV